MKFNKNEVIADQELTPTKPMPILVGQCLVRVPRVAYTGSATNNTELIKRAIIDSDARGTLIDVLSNTSTIEKIVAGAHGGSALVFIGATSSTFETYYSSVSSKLKGIPAVAGMAIATLLVDFMSQYGVVMASSEWSSILKRQGSITEDDLLELIVSDAATKAIAAIPKRGRTLSGRIPFSVFAQNIAEAFRAFVCELMIITNSQRGLISTLARIRDYVLREDDGIYGDKKVLFTESSTFKTLIQNVTVVELALKSVGTSSDPEMWAIEDQRLLSAIEHKSPDTAIETLSLNEVAKMVNSTLISDVYQNTASVILYPKAPEIRERRVYRELKTDKLAVYTKDQRFDYFFSNLDKTYLATESALSALKVAVAEKTDIEDTLSVYWLHDEDNSFDENIYRYYAMSVCRGVYVDVTTRTLFFSFDINSSKQSQRIPVTILNSGMSNNWYTVVSAAGKDIVASKPASYLTDAIIEAEKKRYIDIDETLVSKIDRSIQHVSLKYSQRKNASKAVTLDIDMFRELFAITKGTYIVTGLESVRWSFKLMAAAIEQVLAITGAPESYRLVETVKHLLSIESIVSDLIYQNLWREARNAQLDTSDIYNDIRLRLSIKESAYATYANSLGLPKLSFIGSTIGNNIQYFLEFVKER